MLYIPFSPPHISDDDIDAVVHVLKSGWITTGAVCEEFEQRLTQYLNASHTKVLNSATASMFVALKAMGIGEGDEVITTPYTFAATANVIVHTGAKVVFADVKKDSFYMDTDQVYQKITPKTKAIIPVDFSTAYSWDFDKDLLAHKFQASNVFQEKLNRPLILVDAAHSLGSRYLDESIDMVAFSFHAVKNLTTAEGGALAIGSAFEELTDDFVASLKLFSLHGQNRSAKEKFMSGAWEYDIVHPGYKYNMSDIAAALGLSQLKRYDSEILARRRELTEYYIRSLQNNPRIIMDEPVIFSDVGRSSCHLFPVRISDVTEEQRNDLISFLHQQGIGVNVHFKPLHHMTVSSYYDTNCFYPNSVAQYQNEISLPLHLKLSFQDIDFIAQKINEGLS